MCHDHAHNGNYICHDMSIMAINFVMIMYITLPLWHHQNDAALKRAMIYDRSPQQAHTHREWGGGGGAERQRQTETDRESWHLLLKQIPQVQILKETKQEEIIRESLTFSLCVLYAYPSCGWMCMWSAVLRNQMSERKKKGNIHVLRAQ